jgi:putative ATP-dependent endonuclease of OLD family
MSRIRHVSIRRFRGIASLDWTPAPGINALLGAGDSGKSTVLDAIALALSGSRREVFYDTDFYRLDVQAGLEIQLTVGELPDEIHDVERYGDYLRGWHQADHTLEDEPAVGLEDVLTLRLEVGADLEGHWSLYSERTQGGDGKDLSLAHRALLTPVVLDQSPATHLRWARHSILQRLAEPQFAVRSLVARAARGMREHADAEADAEVIAVLEQVRDRARELGIGQAQGAQVLLDAFGIPGWSASLALHDPAGVPLRRLGTGSARLLVAGLFHSRIAPTGIAVVDEAEFGLEPYRIARFLRLLGAGQDNGPQVFLTTHSPVVVRELRAKELAIMHADAHGASVLTNVGDANADFNAQGLLRNTPEAFLAAQVIVGEGATEVGLARGLDHYWAAHGHRPFAQQGIGVTDGGGIPKAAKPATTFASLGYRTALFMDDDRQLTEEEAEPLGPVGVTVLSWGEGRATEDALFLGLDWPEVLQLLALSADCAGGEPVLDLSVRTHSNGLTLAACRAEDTVANRQALANAAKRDDWFKRIDHAERIGQEILGPGAERASAALRGTVTALFEWTRGGPNA